MGEWERGGGWAVGKMDKATVLLSLLGVSVGAGAMGYSVAKPSWGVCRGRGNGREVAGGL